MFTSESRLLSTAEDFIPQATKYRKSVLFIRRKQKENPLQPRETTLKMYSIIQAKGRGAICQGRNTPAVLFTLRPTFSLDSLPPLPSKQERREVFKPQRMAEALLVSSVIEGCNKNYIISYK